MRNWEKEYTKQFQVRNNSNRKIAEGCSIEHIEYIAEKGRNRTVYKWDNNKNEYLFYRGY